MIKIKQTNIPDINFNNIDNEKVLLSEKIIKNIYPIFDDVIEGRIDKLKNVKKEYNMKKENISENKIKLNDKMNEYNRKKKIKKLIKRISRLIDSGIQFDHSLKHETIILLKVLDNISDESIDKHMNNTVKLINKRFSK
jgi:hypothetical protein